MPSLRHVVIVGASLAGLRAAETLRTDGFDGQVTLVGAEPHLPYDRPPLSKKLLSGDLPPERIQLRKPDEYHDLHLDLRLGVRATGVDLAARRVRLGDGEEVPFDGLIVATGATPRWPATWPRLAGMTALRTLDDCLALQALLRAGPQRVVVVGAGFIGAEVAATARTMGLEVTIVEALPVPLSRALGPRMGAAVSALHRDHGVEVRTGTGVEAFDADGAGHVARVRLQDGGTLDADVVVVGIGVTPETGWLDGSGLEVRDGVVCDPTLAAAGTTGVYAAGDLARWPHVLTGEELRIEHWTNAAEQGATAARNLLAWAAGGTGTPYAPVPFFWSDQYTTKIQFLGRAGEHDEVAVVHGSVDEHRFVALYGRDGRLRGALGLGMPKQLMAFRRLLAEQAGWEEALAFATRQ